MVRAWLSSNRRLALAGVALLALAAAWSFWTRSPAQVVKPRKAPGAPRRAAGGAPGEPVAIDLARLDERGDVFKAGKRDIFDFAPPPPPPPPPPTQPPPPPTTLSIEETAAIEKRRKDDAARPVPLSVKYIGAMEDKKRGLKVAILLTDRQEILTGRPGEIVANRLKIVAIGHESVDVQDVGASNTRRIALKGN